MFHLQMCPVIKIASSALGFVLGGHNQRNGEWSFKLSDLVKLGGQMNEGKKSYP